MQIAKNATRLVACAALASMLMDTAAAVEVTAAPPLPSPAMTASSANVAATADHPPDSGQPSPAPATAATANPSPDSFILGARSFAIPFSVDDAGARPVEVQLYMCRGVDQNWQKTAALRPAPGGPRQFEFTADQDGEYWFATRTIDDQGRSHPATAIGPQLKVFVDTAKPNVTLQGDADADGRVEIELQVVDATEIKNLQLRYATDQLTQWQPVDLRQLPASGKLQLPAADDWQQLSLQAVATDSAGNQSVVSQLLHRPRVATTAPNRFAATGAGVPTGAQPTPYRMPGLQMPAYAAVPPDQSADQRMADQRMAEQRLADQRSALGGFRGAATTQLATTPPAARTPLPNAVAPHTTLPYGAPGNTAPPYGTAATGNPTVPFGYRTAAAPEPAPAPTTPVPAPAPTAMSAAATPSLFGTLFARATGQPEMIPAPANPAPESTVGPRPWFQQPPPANPTLPNSTPLPTSTTADPAANNFFGLNGPAQASPLPSVSSTANPAAETVTTPAAEPEPRRPRTLSEAMRPLSEPSAVQEAIPTPAAEADPQATAADTNRYNAKRLTAEDPSLLQGRVPLRFSDSLRFSLDYELESVGNRGVEAIELYGSVDNGQTWKRWGTDPDRTSPFDIETREEGVFGFRIVVVGSNGLASPRPQNGETPDILVAVDTTVPTTRITGAQYGQGDRIGSLVIQYECQDANLQQRPIALSFSDTPEGPWTTIAAGLRNDGDYVWPADPQLPRQIYLRIDVTDQAGNVGSYILDQPIDAQGLAPRARIRGFQPLSGGTPPVAGEQTAQKPQASFK